MIAYSFDPVPSAARRDFRLKPVDHHVLAVLISFATIRRDSCWASLATIAGRLPALRPGRSGSTVACVRTAQRSIERLKAAGYIDHRRVPRPDPDDDRNLTGWRFSFAFVPTAQVTNKTPDALVTQETQVEVLEPREDDRPRPEVVVSSPGSRDKAQEKPTGPQPAIPDPDPSIVLMIDETIPDEPSRLAVKAMLPRWVAAYAVERVMLAVVEAVERRRRGKVHSLAAYIERILANWKVDGKATPRMAGKTSTSSSGSTVPISAEASKAEYVARRSAEMTERSKADEATAIREAETLARWDSLGVAERERIEGEVDRDCPRPGRLADRSWSRMRLALCLAKVSGGG